MKYKILVVDDEPANLRMIERIFRADYEVIGATSGLDAIEMLNNHDVALIISDQRMPGMTGIEFLKRAAQMRPQTIRIILTGYTDVSDLVEAINSGVVYKYITKPWVNADLRLTVQRAVEYYEATKTQHILGLENERLNFRMKLTVDGFVNVVGEMISQKNRTAVNHCRRTSRYAELIGQQFNLEPQVIQRLVLAALVHEAAHLNMESDIGLDETTLTAVEHRITKKSYENGLSLISSIPDLEDAAAIVRFQHERYDGTGFFDGLDGEKIPFCSRILAVANAFDEITSGMTPDLLCTDEEAADWLRSRAGNEFDPHIVEVCLETDLLEKSSSPGITRSNERVATTFPMSI